MAYLLNVAYALALILVSPWLVYTALSKGKYREGFAAKFLGRVPWRRDNRPCIWLHAVSVGEVNLLAPLVMELERQLPQYECVVSTTTRTGYRLAQTRFTGRMVFYCPLDFSWAVSAAMRRIRPDLLILAELELWPNLITTARKHGAKVAVVNGRLSESSWRGYRFIRPLMARALSFLDLIAVQNQEYAQRFCDLHAPPQVVHCTGSLKFDGAETDRDNGRTRHLAQLARIAPDDCVFLAGSTQQPEEYHALETFRRLHTDHPRLRLLLAPRHAERFDEVARLLDRSGIAWQRRSQLDSHGPDPAARVLLVDTIGELGSWWGTAHIAFVGGSLRRRGGQNMIEPAAYAAAVSFGPNTRNFRDVVAAMLAAEAAVVVANGAELHRFVARCLQDSNYRTHLGRRAQRLVQKNLGAMDHTIRLLRELLPRVDSAPASRAHGANAAQQPIKGFRDSDQRSKSIR